MSEKKKLNEEQLENVTGGVGLPKISITVKYKDTEDGIEQSINLDNVVFPEQEAASWCNTNNKIYVGYEINDGSTNTYDAKSLLDSLSPNK